MEEYRKIFIKNLNEYLDSFQMNQADLANRLSVNKSVVSSWLSGSRYPRMNTMEKIANIFNIEKSDLIEDKSEKETTSHHTKGIRIPVLGRVAAGIPIEAIEDIDEWEEIPEAMAKNGEYFALRIKGESMSPKLQPGDIVIVKKQNDVDTGDTAIVLVNGNDATVKQIKKTETGIMLVGLNLEVYQPHFYSNKEIEELPVKIIGKVIESRHTWLFLFERSF